ncbi:DinB family protein [Mycolicibacterium hippocampi]|nr:DinB family protein [Mycolicibacterium hippocampi]
MIDEARRQFELAWSLAELHLAALAEEDFLWEPANMCWTVHRDDASVWRSDWAETEPDPVPVPTIAWLTWHIDYWWTAAIDALTAPTTFPWDAGSGRTVADTVLWVAVELTKNVSELGQLRLLRAVTGTTP